MQATAIRSAEQKIQALDPEIAVVDQHPLTWYMETMIWGQQRFIAALFAIFSLLGLVLAATGLYSVVSYSVNQRNQEMGIRMALGAQRLNIIGLVLRSVAATVGVGIVVGLVVSIALNRIVSHWVQSSSRDPLTLAGRGRDSGRDCPAGLHLAGATRGHAGSDEGAAHGIAARNDPRFVVRRCRWRRLVANF